MLLGLPNCVRRPRSVQRLVDEDVNLNFVLSDITFPSMPEGSRYRFTVMRESQEELSLKLEKLRSARIWNGVVREIADHGPAGVPTAAVFNVLKDAIAAQRAPRANEQGEVNSISTNTAAAAPLVDIFNNEDGSVTMELTVPFGGIPMEYGFDLVALNRQPIDVLESELKDARDEIEALEARIVQLEAKPTVMDTIVLGSSIHTPIGAGHEGIVLWNQVVANLQSCPTVCFTPMDNQKGIAIYQTGCYMVQVALEGYSCSAELNLNDKTLRNVHFYHAEPNSKQNLHCSMVVLIDRCDSQLTIKVNGNSVGSVIGKLFSVIRLGP